AWLAERGGLKTELVALDGKRFELGCNAQAPVDLTAEVARVAEAVGLASVRVQSEENPEGKGPARFVRPVTGRVDGAVRYKVRSIETKRSSTRPPAPFITS